MFRVCLFPCMFQAQSEHHPSYKNPCWMEPLQHRTYSSLESTYSLHRFDYLGYLRRNSHLSYIVANGTKSQLRCLPYYYIVGTSKCGSTDLHQALERHPAIVAGALKEPKWLIKHRVGRWTFSFHPFSARTDFRRQYLRRGRRRRQISYCQDTDSVARLSILNLKKKLILES